MHTLTLPEAGALATLAIICFNVAFTWEKAGGLVIVYLLCLFGLTWVATPGLAFAIGLATGLCCFVPQLWFFKTFLKSQAFGLWLMLAFFVALSLLLAQQGVAHLGGFWGPKCIPIIWFCLEYLRSEIWKLRFSWLTPAHAMSHPWWQWTTQLGPYALSWLVLLAPAILVSGSTDPRNLGSLAFVTCMVAWRLRQRSESSGQSAQVAGCNLEAGVDVDGLTLRFKSDKQVIGYLRWLKGNNPDAKLLVLPEYSLNDSPSQAILDWCCQNKVHLITGGKRWDNDRKNFVNTAFVINDHGELVMEQGKVSPIPKAPDGRPATEQRLCYLPGLGPVGIVICYGLQFQREVAPLVEARAQAIVVIAMDLEAWGPHEHRLQEQMARMVSATYRIPLLRVVSSGASQMLDNGREVAVQRDGIIAGALPLHTGSIPSDWRIIRFILRRFAPLVPFVREPKAD